jgi:hypothetical protein
MARAELVWLTADQGGRSAPPPGPTFAATAIFLEPSRVDYGPDDHVSVLLRFDEGTASVEIPTPVE